MKTKKASVSRVDIFDSVLLISAVTRTCSPQLACVLMMLACGCRKFQK